MNKDPKKKYVVPEEWPYEDARELFANPDVRDANDPVARTDEQKASLKRKQDEKLQEQRKRKKEEAKAKKDAKAKPRGAN
jgi:flap endonuclease-1